MSQKPLCHALEAGKLQKEWEWQRCGCARLHAVHSSWPALRSPLHHQKVKGSPRRSLHFASHNDLWVYARVCIYTHWHSKKRRMSHKNPAYTPWLKIRRCYSMKPVSCWWWRDQAEWCPLPSLSPHHPRCSPEARPSPAVVNTKGNGAGVEEPLAHMTLSSPLPA